MGAGSTINLTCAIYFSSEPPTYVFWYYNQRTLSYDDPRGGVSVITEKGNDVTNSWLLIQAAQTSDSGEYGCKPSNAEMASVKVHVLNGEWYQLSTCNRSAYSSFSLNSSSIEFPENPSTVCSMTLGHALTSVSCSRFQSRNSSFTRQSLT